MNGSKQLSEADSNPKKRWANIKYFLVEVYNITYKVVLPNE